MAVFIGRLSFFHLTTGRYSFIIYLIDISGGDIVLLDYIALGMVLHKALTGYDIKKEIAAGVGNFYTASYGSLYPALKKLTDKGYLTMTEQSQGNRLKKYYAATEAGRAAFLAWLSSPFDPSSGSVLPRIYFFYELPEEMRKRKLQEYELHYQQVFQKLKAMEKHFSTAANDSEYFELSTLYLGLQHMQDSLRWFRHVREERPLSEFIQGDFERRNES